MTFVDPATLATLVALGVLAAIASNRVPQDAVLYVLVAGLRETGSMAWGHAVPGRQPALRDRRAAQADAAGRRALGLPLTVVVGVVTLLMVPRYWPFLP